MSMSAGANHQVVVKLSARNSGVLNEMQLRNAVEGLYLHPSVPQDRTSSAADGSVGPT